MSIVGGESIQYSRFRWNLNKDRRIYVFIELGGGFVYAEKLAVYQALDFAADFFGIAVREELFLNVGASGPFPEQLLELNFGARFFECEASSFYALTVGLRDKIWIRCPGPKGQLFEPVRPRRRDWSG